MTTLEPPPSPRTERSSNLRLLRRRWLVTGLVLPLLSLAWTLGIPRQAHAGDHLLPAVVHTLGDAAMALFDAAETGDWTAAAAALVRAKEAARGVGDIETTYVTSGGTLAHFFEAQNGLSSDLMEADTAISVQDGRWLVSAADRLVTRADALSAPFKPRNNAIVPRIETLLLLARRMRRANGLADTASYADASAAFGRLWSVLRDELPSATAPQKTALQQSFDSLDASPSTASVRKLYLAVAALRDALA